MEEEKTKENKTPDPTPEDDTDSTGGEGKKPDPTPEADSEPASHEDEPQAPVDEKPPPSWQVIVGIVVLAVWVIALGVYGVDRAFNLGFFPTRLERHLTTYVGQLTDDNAETRKKAEDGLFSYHGFAVPILIGGIRSGDDDQKAACAKCLTRIAEYYYGEKPKCGIDTGKWERWWKRIDRIMTERMDQEADKLQAERQDWARRQR